MGLQVQNTPDPSQTAWLASAPLVRINMPDLVPRNDLVSWWDYRAEEIIEKSIALKTSLSAYVNSRSPGDATDPGDAIARILMQKGIRLHSQPYNPASRLRDFNYFRKHSEGKLLFDEYLDGRFINAVKYQNVNALEASPLSPSGSRALTEAHMMTLSGQVWDPHYKAMPILKEQFGPSIAYRDLVSEVTEISDSKYELPVLDVPENERHMQQVATLAGPQLSMARFEQVIEDFTRYRGAIGYSDDFINNDNARTDVIEKFVMLFAEDFLIQLLHMTSKKYAENVGETVTFTEGTKYAHGEDHVQGTLTTGEWDDLVNRFTEPYRPNRVIANRPGIRAFKDMYQPEQLTRGMRRETDPDTISEFYSLNTRNASVGYGFVQGTQAETGLGRKTSEPAGAASFIAYNLMHSGIVVVFKLNRDQDELDRDTPGEFTARYLGTSVLMVMKDKKGVKRCVV